MSNPPSAPELADQLRLDSQNPWPGLAAFTEGQREYFFGRKEEASELLRCIKRERLTVLFGKSGLGKTSLLHAGLFPQLRAEFFLPVYIRLSYTDGPSSLDSQVRAALEAAIKTADLAEVATPQPDESIWEYVHRRGGNLINYEGKVVTPVLVFDQFEEWFTLGARKEFAAYLSEEFLPSLTDLIENRTPRKLTERLTEGRDLARRYDLEAIGCRILITLREDYLANLENLRDAVPSLVYVDNRMRLTEMNGLQAFSVVADPNPDLVAKDVAEFIVRFAAGARAEKTDGEVMNAVPSPLEQLEIAPAILSLFCRQLNEERLKQRLPSITRTLVMAQGVTIIDDFYNQCIADMHPAVSRLIEDRLLTKAGYRDNIDLAQAKADLERTGAKSSCIDDLVRLRLLQVEEHRGIPRLELTHDVLAEPVKRSRDKWDEQQAWEREQEREREALAQAKRAEQEAVQRARSLQKAIAGTALVCILLAALVIYGVVERQGKIGMAARAEANLKTALRNEETAERMRNKAEENAKEARANADNAARMSAEAERNLAKALANEKRAVANQKRLTQVSTEFLEHCISASRTWYTAAQGQPSDTKRSELGLYEYFLMSEGQCFDVAAKLHGADPENVDITDSFTMIPLRAADSARQRDDKKKSKEYCDRALGLAKSLHNDKASNEIKLLVARTYVTVAYELALISDEAAKENADLGMSMVEDLRKHSTGSSFDDRNWKTLGDVYRYDAYFLEESKKDAEAIQPYEESYKDGLKAHDLKPKNKNYQHDVSDRSREIGDCEERLRHHDKAMGWYEKALKFARESGDNARMTKIYHGMRIALVAQKKYDEAHTLLDQRIRSLAANPKDLRRERDLAAGYGEAAELEEARKRWPQAVEYRTQVVTILAALKADAYDDEQKDLAFAYRDLSWAEIYAGKVEKGLGDIQRGIEVAQEAKDRPTLSNIYSSIVGVLVDNKMYDDARKLLEQEVQALQKVPRDVQRERDLQRALADFARIHEGKEDWPATVKDRKRQVAILKALKEEHAYDDVQKDLASAYGGLSWAEIEGGQFADGLEDAEKGLAEDPTQTWINVNKAHGLLLTGKIEDARDLYLKIKNYPRGDHTLTNEIVDDFKQLCKLGHTRKEMTGIASGLGIDDQELSKCLASAVVAK